MLEEITPLILTYNEAPNIARVLERLTWASHIVVVDSGSTDETEKIVNSHPQAEIIHRPFDSFADQCNFGLSRIKTAWVLSLDADYQLSKGFVAEIQTLHPDLTIGGYEARFVYCIFGRALRGTLYPPRTVLYRKAGALYKNEGHGHRVFINGKVDKLAGVIFHDDRKPLARWVTSQQEYARREADYLLSTDRQELRLADRVRLAAWPAPIAVFIYTLVFKRCILDGLPGWYYALQRLLAETLISLEIIDRRLRASLRF